MNTESRKIQVFYPSGKKAFLLPLLVVLRMERSGVARLHRSSRRGVIGAVLHDGPCHPRMGQKDTHNRETRKNPRGVWTFRENAQVPAK